jgi:hypothetical protein
MKKRESQTYTNSMGKKSVVDPFIHFKKDLK